ncbi:MAG: hypothetical protein PF450_13735 [Bacteroidales bacterium]|jgi:mercuric ion binding protein|nr:hypothetical protein [Bacteroidales bacterium]
MKNQILLIAFMLCISVPNIYGQNHNEQNEIKSKSIWVDGVCGMCKDRIEKAALNTRGVKTANWNVESKMLKLTVDKRFKESRLHYEISSVSHDTKQMKASDEVYNALHN